MRAILVKLAQRFPACRMAVRKGTALLKRAKQRLLIGSVQTDEKLCVFAAYGGRSYACSPKAIYEYMLTDPASADLRFVWLFEKPEQYEALTGKDRTRVLKFGSSEAEQAVARAKYWIINFTAPEHWMPRKDQIYVQCWHGTPLKRLGFDLHHSQNAMNTVEEIHRRYRNDAVRFRYLLSPSPFCTEKFKAVWNLPALGKEDAVLQVGYPRNDFLYNYTQADVRRIREKLGLSRCTKKILLYAPTWRDDQYTPGKGYTYENPVDFGYLREQLGEDYILLFRAHYLVANAFDFAAYEGFVYDVSDMDDVNELYVISDMLITDYSSVFFDYANLKRPIILYMYDLDFYRDKLHDFYLELDALPGEIVRTEEALVSAIRSENSTAHLQAFCRRFAPLDDGRAAKRAVEVLLHDKKD